MLVMMDGLQLRYAIPRDPSDWSIAPKVIARLYTPFRCVYCMQVRNCCSR